MVGFLVRSSSLPGWSNHGLFKPAELYIHDHAELRCSFIFISWYIRREVMQEAILMKGFTCGGKHLRDSKFHGYRTVDIRRSDDILEVTGEIRSKRI
jgi:hypothetical protein